MKTLKKKAKRRIERYSISDLIGTRRNGFFESCACEIRDLVPQGDSYRLRNGTVEAFTLESPVLYSGSVNNNGSITGYVAEANLLYELPGADETGDVSEARYVSDTRIDAASTFFFTSGGCTYMMTSGRICKRAGVEFYDFDSYSATVEVAAREGFISKEECDRATNRFSGKAIMSFTADGELESIRFGNAPLSVDLVTVNGSEIGEHMQDGDTVSLDIMLTRGDAVCIHASYAASDPSALGLIGASGEHGGRTYVYSGDAMYRISTADGALFCSGPVLTLPEGGIKRAFFCSGTLVLAIGEGICTFDEESGTLRAIGGVGAQNAQSICPCGGFAFVASDGYVTRLTISQSGESEALQTVTVKDVFDYTMRGRILGMAYSRADRCLWTLVASEGRRRIFALDTESGIWFEITCFDAPKAIIECADCIAVVCGRTVYYSSPELDADEREDGRHPICGVLVMNPSDLGDPFQKKRILSLAVKASSKVTEVSAELTTDRKRHFIESRRKEYGEATFELFYPRLGLFSYVSATLTITGFGQAALCEAELDVRS